MSRERTPAAAWEARLETLARAHSPALLAYLARRADPPADAADLLAETLLAAWRRPAAVPAADDEARRWLFGVARGVLANHVRGARRRHRLAERLRGHLAAAPHAPDPAQTVARGPVWDALATLGDDDRELVTLVAWEGFGVAEAGAVLGWAPSTARSRFARARARLQRALQDAGEPSLP